MEEIYGRKLTRTQPNGENRQISTDFMQRLTAVFLIAQRLISWTNHFDFGPIIEIIFTQIWNLAENF